MKDTANEVATLEELLHSTECRVKIARILLKEKHKELLPTVLEDLFYGAQLILEHYCVKKG